MEATFLLPWFIFLFVGALDWGFYASALISTQNAARVAAMYTSAASTKAADSAGACSYVLDELRYQPNVGTGVTTCGGAPVTVSAVSSTDPDGALSSTVVVSYQTAMLIPIPGLLNSQITITQTVQMRVRG